MKSIALFLLSALAAHTDAAVPSFVSRAEIGVLGSERVPVDTLGSFAVAVPRRAAFRNTVPNVVGLGTEPQMIRAYTGRVVATMQNLPALGNRPECQLPRDSVRQSRLAPLVAPILESAVAGYRMRFRNPRPAAIRFVNESPETLRLGSANIGAGHRTKATATPFTDQYQIGPQLRTDVLGYYAPRVA